MDIFAQIFIFEKTRQASAVLINRALVLANRFDKLNYKTEVTLNNNKIQFIIKNKKDILCITIIDASWVEIKINENEPEIHLLNFRFIMPFLQNLGEYDELTMDNRTITVFER